MDLLECTGYTRNSRGSFDKGTQYALNVASCGISVYSIEFCENHGTFSNLLKGLRYVGATVFGILALSFSPISITLAHSDQVAFYENTMLVAFGNGRYFGAGVQICPNALIDDGMADVSLIPSSAMPKNLSRLFMLSISQIPVIPVEKIKEATIRAPMDLKFDLDGDIKLLGPVKLQVIVNAIRYFYVDDSKVYPLATPKKPS